MLPATPRPCPSGSTAPQLGDTTAKESLSAGSPVENAPTTETAASGEDSTQPIEQNTLPAPEGCASTALQPTSASDALVRVQEAVAALALPCLEKRNSQGVVFLTCALTPELRSKIEDVLAEISVAPRMDLKILTEKQTGALHLAFEKTRP